MWCRTRTIVAALSLALFASTPLWPRSHHRYDSLILGGNRNHSLAFFSARGGLEIRLRSGGPPEHSSGEIGYVPGAPDERPFAVEPGFKDTMLFWHDLAWEVNASWRCAGFHLWRGQVWHPTLGGLPPPLPSAGGLWVARIPYAGILIGSALLLCAAVLRRRRRPNQCPACGYDLRATPHRCPECSRMPPTVQSSP